MSSTGILEEVAAKTGVVGEYLTVFICASDRQTDPEQNEVPLLACVLDTPPEVDEIGSMGGVDRWKVVEISQYGGKDQTAWVAIVERIDLPSVPRPEWITVAHPHQALHLYEYEEFECVLMLEDEPIESEAWRITGLSPVSEVRHFGHIYLAQQVAAFRVAA